MPIRPIEKKDNAHIEEIVLSVLSEFGAQGEGFAGADPELKDMFRTYSQPRHRYFVIEEGGKILGGGGIAPLKGVSSNTCELQKMYFSKKLRGKGFGQKIIETCLSTAKELGFEQCYLETLETMSAAKHLYHRNGFEKIKCPMGNTGHFGCNTWYLKKL